METLHLHDELALPGSERIAVETSFGKVTGGRARNGTIHFLEVPYAEYTGRWKDPLPLPSDFRYDDREYVQEASYCAQPTNDGQAAGWAFKDKVGYGKPSENPLFLNIGIPAGFDPTSAQTQYPVKIYIHGGFLQFGSPHTVSSQPQYVCAEQNVVWVSVGYRVSVLGFLACDEPKIDGNYGFKDQWQALLWIEKNIARFGGDPNNVQLTGLSAGAHSVHQILHHVSRLPPGQNSPFQSANLQSNALLISPRTPSELRPQLHTLCSKLDLSPDSPNILDDLRAVPISTLMDLISSDDLGEYGTFRGCLDGEWMKTTPDPMEWQKSGELAKGLREKGVRSVLLGHVKDEWYLYSLAHPVPTPSSIAPALLRYFPPSLIDPFLSQHSHHLNPSMTPHEILKFFGDALSDFQVHLPVRILHRDLHDAGFPVVRYAIEWAPEGWKALGKYITHGADRPIWMYHLPSLSSSSDQAIAKSWLERVDAETKAAEQAGRPLESEKTVLTLRSGGEVDWMKDGEWMSVMGLEEVVGTKEKRYVWW